MTDTPEAVAANLEAILSNGLSAQAWEIKDDLRAAASMLRECAEREKKMEAALHGASYAMRLQEAWEADLIMSELEIHSVPAPTQAMWDKLTDELQPSRNESLAQIREALVR